MLLPERNLYKPTQRQLLSIFKDQMNIRQLIVGQMQENCYIVWGDDPKEALIIDPGDDSEYIIEQVQKEELAPTAIIATHGHFDHTMAVLPIKLSYDIPFYMHKDDKFLLKRIDKTAEHFVNFNPGPPPKVDIYLDDKSNIIIGKLNFKIIHTPGHTPGSVCLYFPRDKALFVGDLIFENGYVGRTDFKYGDKVKLYDSLNKLPEGAKVYPGHGGSFTLHKRNFQ